MKGFCQYALQELPRLKLPRRFLIDRTRFLVGEHVTTDLNKAHIWRERTSPYYFLRKHPELKGKFIPVVVHVPSAAFK